MEPTVLETKYGVMFISPYGFGIDFIDAQFDTVQEAFEECLNWAQGMVSLVQKLDTGIIRTTPLTGYQYKIVDEEMLHRYNVWARTHKRVREAE